MDGAIGPDFAKPGASGFFALYQHRGGEPLVGPAFPAPGPHQHVR